MPGIGLVVGLAILFMPLMYVSVGHVQAELALDGVRIRLGNEEIVGPHIGRPGPFFGLILGVFVTSQVMLLLAYYVKSISSFLLAGYSAGLSSLLLVRNLNILSKNLVKVIENSFSFSIPTGTTVSTIMTPIIYLLVTVGVLEIIISSIYWYKLNTEYGIATFNVVAALFITLLLVSTMASRIVVVMPNASLPTIVVHMSWLGTLSLSSTGISTIKSIKIYSIHDNQYFLIYEESYDNVSSIILDLNNILSNYTSIINSSKELFIYAIIHDKNGDYYFYKYLNISKIIKENMNFNIYLNYTSKYVHISVDDPNACQLIKSFTLYWKFFNIKETIFVDREYCVIVRPSLSGELRFTVTIMNWNDTVIEKSFFIPSTGNYTLRVVLER